MAFRSLVPWSNAQGRNGGIEPFSTLHREVNRVFDDLVGNWDLRPISNLVSGFNPKLRVTEDPKEIVVSAELAGMQQNDIDISFTKGVLTLRGEKTEKRESKEGETVHLSEISHGSFSRSVQFQSEIDEDKIDASFKDGVLTIKLPKTEKARREEKKITVRAA